jgi:hypothetical protein
LTLPRAGQQPDVHAYVRYAQELVAHKTALLGLNAVRVEWAVCDLCPCSDRVAPRFMGNFVLSHLGQSLFLRITRDRIHPKSLRCTAGAGEVDE